jgi:hypothetical protein
VDLEAAGRILEAGAARLVSVSQADGAEILKRELLGSGSTMPRGTQQRLRASVDLGDLWRDHRRRWLFGA